MFIPTHRLIARHAYQTISGELKPRIHPIAYIYGNMKPDVAPALKAKKHYMDPTLDFVIDQMIALVEDALEEKVTDHAFSVRLGVISHFIADFFCWPHYDRPYFESRLREHLQYEKILHGKFLSFQGCTELNVPYLPSMKRSDIEDFILEMHEPYKKSAMGFENDIVHSLHAVSAVGLVVCEHARMYHPNTAILLPE